MRAAVDARRRAGLQAVGGDRQLAQCVGERGGRRIAGAAAGVVCQADMDLAGEESAGGQHDGARARNRSPICVTHAGDAAALDDQVVDRLLEQLQVRLGLHDVADGRLVQHAVGLAARRAHRRTLGLRSTCATGCRARSAARAIAPPSASISLTRWPLPMPPMAGLQLICPIVSMLCVSSSVRAPHARRGQRGLGAGVAAADHDDVVVRLDAAWGSLGGTERCGGPLMVAPSRRPDVWRQSPPVRCRHAPVACNVLDYSALSRADAAHDAR